MRHILALATGLALGACGGGAGGSFTPTDPEVLRVQNNFLEDVVEAEIASRIAAICPEYSFNDAEGTRVQDRFGNAVKALYANPKANPSQVLLYQQHAEENVSSKPVQRAVGARAAKWIAEKGATKQDAGPLCVAAAQEVENKSQIGRFLTPLAL